MDLFLVLGRISYVRTFSGDQRQLVTAVCIAPAGHTYHPPVLRQAKLGIAY